ncbi:PiggyBac transposable element-derived protein 4 [Eumeta japonica]|uniref:PiggyBac transposable element-derived protein 4 n=1 Tax=Eumeta variegata TaxID=151549 RepID=A0A4C1WUM2_EUMVA|nr:PiggyBac transposable element-derived protein 4 [Eumeta japonica]
MVRKFSVRAYTCRGVGAERFEPNTEISSFFVITVASNFASSVVIHVSVITTTIQTPQTSQVVTTDVEERVSVTEELLIELEIDEFEEPRETSNLVYVIEIIPIEDTQHDTISQVLSNLAAPVTVSAKQPAGTHQVVIFANVYVSAGEDMLSSSRTFYVSSPTEALLDLESEGDSEYSNKSDAEYHITSAQTEVQRDLPHNEDLPSDVATSIRIMETLYTIHRTARWGIKSFELCESRTGYSYKFVIYTGGDDKKEAKGKKRVNDNNDDKEGVNDSDYENIVDYFYDDCDERAESGRDRVKNRRQKHEQSLNKKQTSDSKTTSNPTVTSGTAPNPNNMAKALTEKTTQLNYIVLNLLEDLENKGYCVTMDNFYNSPALAQYLKCRGFDCLGTVRLTRKNIQKDVKKDEEKV